MVLQFNEIYDDLLVNSEPENAPFLDFIDQIIGKGKVKEEMPQTKRNSVEKKSLKRLQVCDASQKDQDWCIDAIENERSHL